MRRLLPWTVIGAALCAGSSVAAEVRVKSPAATVSLLEGTAQVRRGTGTPRDLRQGSTLQQDDVVETGDDSRTELKFPEGGILRIAQRTRLSLAAPRFSGGPAAGHPSVRLFIGKVWARATDPAGRDRVIGVETANEESAARGGTFRVDAHDDRSVLVRAYSGTVVVKPTDGKAWAMAVRKQMQILISPDGTPGVPAPFSEADEKDDGWSAWNRKRDEQGK